MVMERKQHEKNQKHQQKMKQTEEMRRRLRYLSASNLFKEFRSGLGNMSQMNS